MKYLLDTHVLLWTLFDEEKLSPKAKGIIEEPDNKLFISLVTYWEISLKYGLGKLELNGVLPEELPQQASSLDIATLSISESEVPTFYKLPRTHHKDPFDRLIIWQSINRELILISKDHVMDTYEPFGLKALWS